MKKTQKYVVGVAIIALIALNAATQNQIFGEKKVEHHHEEVAPSAITFDTILLHAKEKLTPQQLTKLNFIEKTISRGDVKDQQQHVFHQLATFWADSAREFTPYAFYTAEAARLENSEKSLTFAAHLFLNNLRAEEDPAMKQWKALQAKDLFERSLKINPDSDSSEVGLGATYLYGGIGESPMEGIQKIRKVAERDSNNVYAQLTLGHASVASGQLDKAEERFKKVIQIQPQNLEAALLLADIYERKNDKKNAVLWYKKSLSLINIPGLKEEVELRITELSK